jgi:glycerophosphoryl diester phosphodiesterase
MLRNFEIVAHRGVPDEAPENTLPSFQRAIDLGADAVELDVRLTADRVPAVFHYFYLDGATSLAGPIFDYTFDQLRHAPILGGGDRVPGDVKIPTLGEVLDAIGGRIGLEIEVKGPEPESSEIVGAVLGHFKHLWETIEVTSYEPVLLLDIQRRCPDLATDLLFPRSESWMKQDVVAYLAAQRARLARARAVHLHPSQLSAEVVAAVRQQGVEVHAWDVNDEQALAAVAELAIPRLCTDKLRQALDFRQRKDNL